MKPISELGQGFMEYAILIVIIAVLVMGILVLFGPGTLDMYAFINASF